MWSNLRADFDIVKVDETKKIVFLVDLNLGGLSVTNDAEQVYILIKTGYPEYRVIFRDSIGDWDEIESDDGGKTIRFRDTEERPW